MLVFQTHAHNTSGSCHGPLPSAAVRYRRAAPPAPAHYAQDARQIDLEEVLGTARANQATERLLNHRIGQRLRHKRQESGLSMQELGKRIARSGQQIQKYEVGRDAIKATTLVQLAEALNTPIATFFEGLV